MAGSNPDTLSTAAMRIALATGAIAALVIDSTAFALGMDTLPVVLGGVLAGVLAGGLAYWISHNTLMRGLAEPNHQRTMPLRPTLPFIDGGLEPTIDHALSENATTGSVVSVLVIAVDRIEEIEVGLGLDIVQAVKTEIFQRLAAITRSGEPLVERHGVLTLVTRNRPGEHEDVHLAQRLLDQFDPLIEIGTERIKVSLSIGIARQSPGLSGAGALLRQADIALNEAQRLGGGQYILYTSQIDDIFETRSRIAGQLAGAISEGKGLGLVYQPIFDMDGSTMVGAEALLRWNHPVHGRLDRRLLIDIAEAEGLIGSLGDWTLDEAVDRLARSALPWIAVNIASGHLRDPRFTGRLAARLDGAGLSAERLHVEIATDAVRDPSLAETLETLRNLGIFLVLDGFEMPREIVDSAGWRSIPFDRIDQIKLSAALAPVSGQDFAVEAALWSFAGYARGHGVSLAVKGVEARTQHDMFARLGMSQIQGRHYAPTTTALTVETLIGKMGMAG